jgi:hypothetical protein
MEQNNTENNFLENESPIESEGIQSEELNSNQDIAEDSLNQSDDVDRSNDKNVEAELDEKWLAHKKRLSKIQREKHRIAAEAQQLREENENLKRLTQTSHQVSQSHYENSLKLRLDQAKEAKRKALELNDYDGILEADNNLFSTLADIKELENWKAQESVRQQLSNENVNSQVTQQSVSQQDFEEPIVNEVAERWLQKNAWFDPNSSHYDPDKAEEVHLYAQAFDASLARQGRENEYFSKEYFNRIDNFAHDYDRQRNQSSEERRSGLMSASPVKRSSNTNNGSNNRIVLTEDDKYIARQLGIKEQDYLKHKLEQMNIEKQRYSNNYRGA